MAYRRGRESIEKEVYKMQIWIEEIDPILHGNKDRGGSDIGLVQEHIKSRTEKAHTEKIVRGAVLWMSFVGTILGALEGLRFFHVIH